MLEERRQFPRLPFKEPLQYRQKEGEPAIGCLAADIGEGGVRFNSNEFIPLNRELSIQASMAPDKLIDLKGRVAWIQLMPYSDRYQVGLQFDAGQLPNTSRREIRQYIQAHPNQ